MISIKSEKEIQIMQEGGAILKEVLQIVLSRAKEGVKLCELDKIAEEEIVKRGAYPSFKKVEGYRWSICACINDIVVHGVPGSYRLRDLDVVGIDCGVFYKGFHTDSSWTGRIKSEKETDDEIDIFIKKGEETLVRAIKEAKAGNRVYDISKTIQTNIEEAGYSVVRSLVGHGIGKKLHEEPEIPGIAGKKRLNTPLLKEGMTIAIEVIYNMGSPDVVYNKDDGWTISTKDGKISGLFEATVALKSHGCIILT